MEEEVSSNVARAKSEGVQRVRKRIDEARDIVEETYLSAVRREESLYFDMVCCSCVAAVLQLCCSCVAVVLQCVA